MVKRKLKTTESGAKLSKTNDPNDERKEKLVPFDFSEEDCDVIIVTKDKEIHLPSDFLMMASKDVILPLTDGKMTLDASSDTLVKLLSFYHPRSWDGDCQCKLSQVKK